MAIYFKTGGIWRPSRPYLKWGGNWVPVNYVYFKSGGVWRNTHLP